MVRKRRYISAPQELGAQERREHGKRGRDFPGRAAAAGASSLERSTGRALHLPERAIVQQPSEGRGSFVFPFVPACTRFTH